MAQKRFNYPALALDWRPGDDSRRQFLLIMLGAAAVVFWLALILATVDVPEEPRKTRIAIPERVAKFIDQREKPKPPPKPEPKELPKPKPKPEVKTLKKAPEIKKPLTETEKKARKKAEESGLMALANELSELVDTSEVDAMVGVDTRRAGDGAGQAAGYDQDLYGAGAGQGSGGVDGSQYAGSRTSTQLSSRERTAVRQELLTGRAAEADADDDDLASATAAGRSEEELTVIFDRNKGSLYSVYNRARRSNPGLKGRIVIELTITPAGKVAAVRIVSSELNDPKLERSILRRIKTFTFPSKDVEEITVTYPIEFLPS